MIFFVASTNQPKREQPLDALQMAGYTADKMNGRNPISVTERGGLLSTTFPPLEDLLTNPVSWRRCTDAGYLISTGRRSTNSWAAT
jgi:hypothetical protein